MLRRELFSSILAVVSLGSDWDGGSDEGGGDGTDPGGAGGESAGRPSEPESDTVRIDVVLRDE
jgi:hypothetical protein